MYVWMVQVIAKFARRATSPHMKAASKGNGAPSSGASIVRFPIARIAALGKSAENSAYANSHRLVLTVLCTKGGR